ncbi:MAG: hypothetical protein QM676_06490 [Novosphingobium sp.]
MRGGRTWLALAAVCALAACGSSNDAAGPGDVTVSEAKALDEAAEMIEARKPPPAAGSSGADRSAPLPPDLPAPKETAAAR